MVEKHLLKADKISQMLGIRQDTLYRWVSQKRIPSVKIGRITRFDIEEINKWIKEKSIAAKDF